MFRFLVPALLAASFATFPATVLGQGADAALDKAVATYGKMDTFHATFEQTLTNPLTGSTMQARGEVHRQKPNLISVRFTDPAGDRIVIDGSAIWLYMPSTNPNIAYKMPMGAGSAGAFDPVQLMESPRARFEVGDGGSAMVGERRTQIVTLVPKSAGGPFTSAKVWIDAEGAIRQFEVTDGSGMTRRVRLLTVRQNVAVPRSTFRFTPPEGVQVVDQTSRG